MNSYGIVFAIIFFIVFAICIVFGIYTIRVCEKRVKWIFLFVCISLGLWALGFSMSISAPDEQICLFWRQFSCLGWGSFFSVLLHFFLTLTEKNRFLSHWWSYLILYLPCALTIAAFSFYTGLNPQQYYLIYTSMGWTNVAANTAWDWLYMAYYIGFIIMGFILVWDWGRRLRESNVKKQTRLILAASFIALFLGTITDMLCNSFFKIRIPQVAPLVLLVPVSAIYFSIKRYGFLAPKPIPENERMLTKDTRLRIYNYISIAFVAGGLLNFITEYLMESQANFILVVGQGLLICMPGLVIHLVKQFKLSDKVKDIVVACAISASLPIITLLFIRYAAVTVWAIAFILIIVSLVFDKHYVIASVTGSAIFTQVLVWAIHPQISVLVTASDYIVRIGLLGIAVWLAGYLNKAFSLRLKENAKQIDYEKLIAEISFDFLSVTKTTLAEKINAMLEKLGTFFTADHAFVCLFDELKDTMRVTYCYHCEGVEKLFESKTDIPIDAYPWWLGQIEDVERLSVELADVKESLNRKGIRSLIAIPIEGEGIVHGFLGLDFSHASQAWNNDQLSMLRVFTNLISDGFAKVKAEEKIEYMAYYDHLTGLPNRTLFTDRVNQAIHLAERFAKLLGVVFIDLDSFKAVNDTMGHNGGDTLLKEVAIALARKLRKMDTVARFGGDEFLVMLNSIASAKNVVKIVQGIMEMFEKPFVVNNQEFFVTASAGIAVYPVDGEDTETLVKNADIAMYKAKSLGKNQFVLCTTDLKDKVQKEMTLTNSLYRALERGELMVYYQPQVSLHTRRIVGLEALVRWKHPQLGMIPPSVFIPLAEKSGMIGIIGDWVLRTACFQNRRWLDMGAADLRIGVNLSVNQFRNPALVDSVDRILKETHLDPKYLELEITESIAIKEAGYIIDVLEHLKQLGLSISIDDFGTEYSSLSRLKNLPIDRIKIDMQFVQGIENSEKDRAITKIIINLAKSLGLKVIAEGVETLPQLEFLNQRMCDEVQGFYYYKPMPAEEIDDLIQNWESMDDLAMRAENFSY